MTWVFTGKDLKIRIVIYVFIFQKFQIVKIELGTWVILVLFEGFLAELYAYRTVSWKLA